MMKEVFASNKHNFCLVAFPFVTIRFSVLNPASGNYELMIPQEKLMENWVWNIQWSPFRIKQVRLLENEVPRPNFAIEFQPKMPVKPTGMPKVVLNRLSVDGIDIERKPTKLSINSCELKNTRPINLSQLNPQ
jgi:hypothetical protein